MPLIPPPWREAAAEDAHGSGIKPGQGRRQYMGKRVRKSVRNFQMVASVAHLATTGALGSTCCIQNTLPLRISGHFFTRKLKSKVVYW